MDYHPNNAEKAKIVRKYPFGSTNLFISPTLDNSVSIEPVSIFGFSFAP